MENELSFLKKMSHSTNIVDNEFMTSGNIQFFLPKLQFHFDIDVSEIFSPQFQKKNVSGDWQLKNEIKNLKPNERQIIYKFLRLNNPDFTRNYIPSSIKPFQCACSLISEQKIYIDSYKYKGDRRNHFIRVKQTNTFGNVKIIFFFEEKIEIAVEILLGKVEARSSRNFWVLMTFSKKLSACFQVHNKIGAVNSGEYSTKS